MGALPNGTAKALVARLAPAERFIRWNPTSNRPSWVTFEGALTPELIQKHLNGECIVGAHVVVDGVARFGILDIDLHLKDREPTLDEVQAVEKYAIAKSDELARKGINCLLIRGHHSGSYHVYFSVTTMAADRLGRWLKAFVADSGSIHVDTFPSQEGEGNAVRLPGRHHKRQDNWSESWSGSHWEPWPAVINRFVKLPENPARLFPDPGKKRQEQHSAPTAKIQPGDVFNLLVSVEDVLKIYGWTFEREDGERIRYTRPGKDGGISASVKGNSVWIYSSSIPNLPVSEKLPYTPFGVIAHLEFGGNFKEAARELAKRGFCAAPVEQKEASSKPESNVANGPARPGVKRPNYIAPYQPFPVEVLPEGVREYVCATAKAMNCDLSYSALPVLAALSAAIGSSHVVSPKRGWREPPYIWALPIGKSGATKSPPYRDVEDMCEDINDQLEKEYESAKQDYQNELEIAAKDKSDGRDPSCRKKPPKEVSFIKGDTTIEALIGTLQDSPRGILIGQDELSAWINWFVKYKGRTGASDLPNWLKLHYAGTINNSRKTGDRTKVRIRDVGVSVVGTIQPKILSGVLTDEFRSSGFLARLLLAMPPWKKRQWTEAEVDEDTRKVVSDLLNDLYRLPADAWPDSNRQRPHIVRLSDEAKQLFVAFYNSNGEALEIADEDMSAAMSKLEGYALRFSLIFHVCRFIEDAGKTSVIAEDMKAAIKLTKWFKNEAERVYTALSETPEQQEARQLFFVVSSIAKKHDGRITVKIFQRSNQRKYPTSELAECALDSLVGCGFGEWQEARPAAGSKGGRPTKFFVPYRPEVMSSELSELEPSEQQRAGENLEPCVTKPPLCDDTSEDKKRHKSISENDLESDSKTSGEVSSLSSHVIVREKVDGEVAGNSVTVLPKLDYISVSKTIRVPSGSEHPYRCLIADTQELSNVCSAIEDDGGMIGLDTETTGLNPIRDRVRLLQLATIKGTYLIDLFAMPDPAGDLAELFQVLSRSGIVGHNLAFDLPFLMRLGFEPDRVFDSMLASQVLHAGEGFDTKHSLKELASRHLHIPLEKELQKADWSGPLSPEMLQYASLDAELVVRLQESLLAKLDEANLKRVVEIENAALPCLAWTGLMGVGFDKQAWGKLASESLAEKDRLAELLDSLAPSKGTLTGTTNWNSPEQVVDAFKSLEIALDSTDDDALASVYHPLARTLREYRSAAKLAGTYGADWLKHVAVDGRVYATWKQIGAGSSGRMSCKEPNLQQLPRDPRYRRCFVAPPGRVLVKADYSQIELRIAAKIANERRMLEAYQNGEDLHALTASLILNKPVKEVAKADRQLAKAVNFGLLYGQGAEGLLKYARSNYGVSLTIEEATAHREKFFQTYSGLRKWHRSLGKEVRDTRTLTGRRRLKVESFTEKANTPVQGTGADGLKQALGLLWKRRSHCPGAFPVLLVHDEIVVECAREQVDDVKRWLMAAMKDGMEPIIEPVPVEVEATVGPTWGG